MSHAEPPAVPFTDADSRRSIAHALRMVGIAVVLGMPLLWWKLGWASAVLFAVGALISGSGIFEWLRLMTAITARMDATPSVRISPLGPVLAGFFTRLAIALVLLYVSLNYLNGSVYALIAGLALGLLALCLEGLRLIRAWTV
jgi:small-conductance mechanosensitive channel